MAQIGSRLIDATAGKITDDFFKAFEAQLQARAPAGAADGADAACRAARTGRDDRLGARDDRRRGHALPGLPVSASPAAPARSLRAAFGAATALTAALCAVALPLPAWAQVADDERDCRVQRPARRRSSAATSPRPFRLAAADPAARSRAMSTAAPPLHVATFARQRRRDRARGRRCRAGALDDDRYDAVTIAAVADDEETLRVLLALGASARLVTSRYDGTALIAAAHLGHDGVVRQLIAAGAPLDHVNNLHWTALIESIVLGDGGPRHLATLRALLDAGASTAARRPRRTHPAAAGARQRLSLPRRPAERAAGAR